MARRIKRLQLNEAVSRLDEMIDLVDRDVRVALGAEAALETANQIVTGDLRDAKFYGANAFNAVSQSMAIFLAMTLSKLFEQPSLKGMSKGTRYNKSDVASIPLMIRLLRQKRCQAVLRNRATDWTPQIPSMTLSNVAGCQRAIDRAIEAYDKLARTRAGRAAMARLRKFRDKVVAHSLLGGALKVAPTYREMFLLMDVARDVTEHARLAIAGIQMDLKDTEEDLTEAALAFWRPALFAASKATGRRAKG